MPEIRGWDDDPKKDFIHFRIRPPSDFDEKSFKNIEIAPGVESVMGHLKNGDGKMHKQNLLFSRKHFTIEKAKSWVKAHKDAAAALSASAIEALVAVASSGGGIGSVIDFPASVGEPQKLPEDAHFKHTDELDPDEPALTLDDEKSLPRLAFAEMGEDGNRTTWGYAHHHVKGATAKDEMGTVSDGKMYLNKAALQKCLGHADMMHLESPARDHMMAHAKAIGVPLPQGMGVLSGADAADAVALAAGRNGQSVTVDFEAGIIRNVALMSIGPARPARADGVSPEDYSIDEVTLRQLVALTNSESAGVKSHWKHVELEGPLGQHKDKIGNLVGRVKNARIVDGVARGDVHLHAAAAKSPGGNYRDYLLGLADESTEAIGMSAIFHPDREATRRDGALRLAALKSVDFVGEAGSNEDGLLSAGPGAASQSGKVKEGAASCARNGGKENPMDPKLRAYLEKVGLKSGATEAEAEVYLAGLTGNQKAAADAIKAGKEVVILALSTPVSQPAADAPKDPKQAITADRQYRKDLIALAKEHNLPETWADGLYNRNVPIAHARELVATARAMAPVALADVKVTRDGSRDKLVALGAGVTDAIRIRSARANGEKEPKDPSARAAQFLELSPVEMFRVYLAELGVPDTQYIGRGRCVDLMMDPRKLHRQFPVVALAAGAEGSSDFPSLLMDAINKTLRQAYLDIPVMWPRFCKKNTGRDFKPLYSIAMSEFPDLLAENEAAEAKDAAISDGNEHYSLGVFRRTGSLTWKAFINDDLSGFNRIPLLMATAARRKEDDVAFAPITSNQMMADGYNLFDATYHKNIVSGTGAAIPSVTSLAAMRTLLKKQKGPAGAARLEISLGISLVPITLETLLEQVLHSTWDPEASAFERKNPFANKVEMVSNSRLDDASEDAWYGLALLSDSVVGMEIAFLESQEGPVIKQETDFRTDDIRFAIRHVVAAHAIDWRAFVQNPGQ